MTSAWIFNENIYSALTLKNLSSALLVGRFALKHLTVLASSSYTSYKELWQEALNIQEVRMLQGLKGGFKEVLFIP